MNSTLASTSSCLWTCLCFHLQVRAFYTQVLNDEERQRLCQNLAGFLREAQLFIQKRMVSPHHILLSFAAAYCLRQPNYKNSKIFLDSTTGCFLKLKVEKRACAQKHCGLWVWGETHWFYRTEFIHSCTELNKTFIHLKQLKLVVATTLFLLNNAAKNISNVRKKMLQLCI